MAMHADDRLADIGNFFENIFDQSAVFPGIGIADSVGNIDRRRARVDDGLHDFADVIPPGARGVFGGKFHVIRILLSALDGVDGDLANFLLGFLQFLFYVNGAGGDERMNAGILGMLHRFPATVNVLVHGAGQAADLGAVHLLGNGFDGFEISGGGDGESRFNHVNTETFQLKREFQLFLQIHAETGRLLAIPQRRVKNYDFVAHDNVFLSIVIFSQ